MPLEVEHAEEVPEGAPRECTCRVGSAADALSCANYSDGGFLEGREEGGKEGWWPEDVVVAENCDSGADLCEAVGDLEAFVGLGAGDNVDIGFEGECFAAGVGC